MKQLIFAFASGKYIGSVVDEDTAISACIDLYKRTGQKQSYYYKAA
ncbi:hypothetical protein [Subtercola vilae]|nr:hypothetical protein [Subtercola vilae]